MGEPVGHDPDACGLGMMYWDLCPGCVAEGFQVVQERYFAALRKKPLVEPTPEEIEKAKQEEDDFGLPF